jgi:putative iron-regulated protein
MQKVSCISMVVAGLAFVRGSALASDDVGRDVVSTYSCFLAAAYDDAAAAARDMQKAIAEFLMQPSAERLGRAREAWIAARGTYLLTEIGRFYGGPIDDPRNLENQINPWPIDESYIESSPGSPVVGIIQNRRDYPTLTPEVIAHLNAREGEKNIACGWHAIEFLLWGVDTRKDGPGQRPVSDFTTEPDASRRAEYLKSATTLLVADLETVARGWRSDGAGKSFRAKFESRGQESLACIFTALYQLSGFELSSERVLVAVDTQAQEDETDCFSDATSGEFVWGARAILNVWRGEWTRRNGEKLSGTGLRALVAARNPAIAEVLDGKMAASLTKCQSLPAPFDQAILKADGEADKEALRELAEGFEAQADLLAHFAKRNGIELEFEHIETRARPRGDDGASNALEQ